jgi:hypothetical protein
MRIAERPFRQPNFRGEVHAKPIALATPNSRGPCATDVVGPGPSGCNHSFLVFVILIVLLLTEGRVMACVR